MNFSSALEQSTEVNSIRTLCLNCYTPDGMRCEVVNTYVDGVRVETSIHGACLHCAERFETPGK